MATKTLTQNINQAISDFNGVKQAIIDKGVQVPIGTPTSQYGAKIGEIQTGGGTAPEKGFQPTEYDADGYVTSGTLYGLTTIPKGYFHCAQADSGFFCRLANVIFENDITSIGYQSFYYCSKLKLTSLPSRVTSIGNYAFSSCKNLVLTSLPSGVTTIGDNAFYFCDNLALTSLPSGVTSIGNYAFYYCKKLALTSSSGAITSIGNYAFSYCTGLTTMSIGSSIQTINSSAFSGCTNLTQITIDRAAGTVTGAPWGASNATVNWTGTN